MSWKLIEREREREREREGKVEEKPKSCQGILSSPRPQSILLPVIPTPSLSLLTV
jgi:transposase